MKFRVACIASLFVLFAEVQHAEALPTAVGTPATALEVNFYVPNDVSGDRRAEFLLAHLTGLMGSRPIAPIHGPRGEALTGSYGLKMVRYCIDFGPAGDAAASNAALDIRKTYGFLEEIVRLSACPF
ncbi:MAG: hypothetical protein ACXWQO_12935 [Bdellovibrionota bacterium]